MHDRGTSTCASTLKQYCGLMACSMLATKIPVHQHHSNHLSILIGNAIAGARAVHSTVSCALCDAIKPDEELDNEQASDLKPS